MALTKIGTDGVKDDAVTSDKVADSINTAIAANTAKTQTTINNNADNRVITGSGTANTLNAESNVVIDSSGNLNIPNDSGKIQLGTSSDLQIYHDGGDSVINNNGGNLYINAKTGETAIRINRDADVQLYYDNLKKLSTESNGITISNDNTSAAFCRFTTNGGTTRSYVYANSSNQIGFLDQSTNWIVNFKRNDNSFLYGSFLPSTDNNYDLGSSSYRWRNVYTTDLNLSNEGSSNDVDGSWGDWTIQEGESDLFLKNNRSGKKYKFNLTEVS